MMMDNFMVGYEKERLDDVTQEELFSLDFVKRMSLSHYIPHATHVAVEARDVTGFVKIEEFFSATPCNALHNNKNGFLMSLSRLITSLTNAPYGISSIATTTTPMATRHPNLTWL